MVDLDPPQAPNRFNPMILFCRSSCFAFASVCGKGLRLVFKLLVAFYFIFCALFLILRYGFLPNVERYKPDVEHAISKAKAKHEERQNRIMGLNLLGACG